MFKVIKIFFKILITAILVVAGISVFVKLDGEFSIKSLEEVKNNDNDYECILVLGAGVYTNGTPTRILKDRLDRGVELYRKGAAPKLLLSGDNGTTTHNEVRVMKNYCIQQGVAAKDVFLDHAGFSTYDSMYRAKNVFGINRALVVTQRYHEGRALYIAKRLGIRADGVSAIEPLNGISKRQLCREFLARDKDFVKCIFKPESKYTGEPIDITGNGQVTW